MEWRKIPRSTPVEARVSLHWAAQLASAPGTTLLDDKGDWQHTNLAWDPDANALVGRRLPDGRRAGLRPQGLVLTLAEQELDLVGRSYAEGLAWLAQALGTELHRSDHDMPAAPPTLFSHHRGHGELGDWFHDAHGLLEEVRAGHDGASEVRCWPHHFDIATLITLDADEDAETARSIGVGLSPGDGGIAEPYFYVTPWPYPEDPELPALPSGGTWNTDGWTGAVLRGSALLNVDDQEQAARAFLRAGIDAVRAMI